ncbi:hypothetical protein ACO22_08143, partial [Paracoccidioides brasiliensis]
NAIAEYKILSEKIYNVNETDFAMRLCATTKVITSSEHYSWAKLLQPGNQKGVIVIESVNSSE